MPVTRARAQQLLTKAEFEFAAQSWSPAVNAHSPARLRQKISRARRLRDKYRDEARRQAGEAKGRRDPRGTRPARGNRNTELKAAIFDETLVRFEARLAKVQEGDPQAKADTGSTKAPPAKSTAATGKGKAAPAKAKSPATKAKATAKGKAAPTKTTGRKAPTAGKATAGKASTQASKAARKSGKITKSGAKKTQTHARARTGRSQARKDGR